MTELEKHLSAALPSLSAQYEQLQGHVNDLGEDYARLTEDYRQIANALGRLSRR